MKEVDHDEFDDIYKIIVIGDAGTGKTNLIFSFSKEKLPTNIMPTVVVEFTSKIIKLNDNRVIKAQIWDTAGQEQYRALTMNHYRKALGAIIVFDVASRNSFFHVNTWLEATRERADHNVQIMLVGHKVDQNRREISRQEAEQYANKNHILYTETTINDPQSIKNAFNKLIANVANVKSSEVKGLKLNEHQINNPAQEQRGCAC